jgi:uncharacterized protein (TIGR03118 family)
MRIILFLVCVLAAPMAMADGYRQVNLAANQQIYAPQILDKNMKNAWGMAIRPAGAGGHFWISNTDTGTVSLYVGDVGDKKLYQDDIQLITVPAAKRGKTGSPTGQVFNPKADEFIVTQDGITAGSKFIFASEDGVITAWTEEKTPNGVKRPSFASITVDQSNAGAIYKGLAISNRDHGNYIYAADFANNRIDVFGPDWQRVALPKTAFAAPGVPKNYAPFNIESFGDKLYVAYAKTTATRGEEAVGAGMGYVAEYDFDGNLQRMLQGRGKLNAPWGMAVAPENFGPASGQLLVGNFGDGTIVGFDVGSGNQTDYLRMANGDPVAIDGLWDIMFGNGQSLGEANHLYFAAGPRDESDGLFGKLVFDAALMN